MDGVQTTTKAPMEGKRKESKEENIMEERIHVANVLSYRICTQFTSHQISNDAVRVLELPAIVASKRQEWG